MNSTIISDNENSPHEFCEKDYITFTILKHFVDTFKISLAEMNGEAGKFTKLKAKG